MHPLEDEIKQAFDLKELNTYEHRFSPSALPFCARRYSIYNFATEDIKGLDDINREIVRAGSRRDDLGNIRSQRNIDHLIGDVEREAARKERERRTKKADRRGRQTGSQPKIRHANRIAQLRD